MGQRLSQLHQSLDRRWRGGHPFRPRLSPQRRFLTLLLFICLCAVIGGYGYLTDADRVRAMAEAYLSKVLGGRVDVGRANLSIFQGLRLDDVRVHVDQSPGDDSLLFRAKTFKVDYNPRALLAGKLEAAQIVAIGPELRLVQDRDTGEWNYQHVLRAARRRRPTTRPAQPVVFPEILLRDGRVDNGELAHGQYVPRGTLGFEGRLSPTGDGGRYAFEIQSHGPNDPVGPSLVGWVVPDTGQVRLRLRDFSFGRDIRGMLPADVRSWWQRHALAGRIDSTDVSFSPATKDHDAEWRVETSFKGVTLRIHPEEWRGAAQNLAIARFADAVDFSRSLALGSPAAAPNLLFRFTSSVPVRLQNGQGTLAFDQTGVHIKDLRGTIEGSAVQITGHYAGYSPDAPMDIHLASVAPRHINLPEQPKFIYSLPPEVQEIWRRFHPVGACRLSFDVTRDAPGQQPDVAGVVEILDGHFTCDRFPYTLHHARGEILIGRDETNGLKMELRNLRGYGRPGGPNEHALVTVNGLVDHLGPDPGMHLTIAAKDVISEPAVRQAIPPDVQQVLTLFDAPGKGQFPTFAGSFKCWIIRPPGRDKHIDVNLDLDIRHAAGRLRSFPYPLDDFSARAEIRDDYVDIPWSHMKRGDAELSVTGRVRWKDYKHTGEPIGTNLKVAVKNMPIDQDLLAALPPVRRQWLQTVGLTGGALDFQGRVFSDTSPDDISVDLDLTLKNASLHPTPKSGAVASATPPPPAVSDINGHLHLTGDQIQLQNLTGRRADATLTLNGSIHLAPDNPSLDLTASATNLAADPALYNLLPPPARAAWDAVSPQGTFDATATYTGPVTPTSPSSNPQSAIPNPQSSTPAPALSLTLRPRNLSVTPKLAPYRLDNLTGQVSLADGKITLTNLKGTHGKGTLTVSGSGSIVEQNGWNLELSGANLTVDGAFLQGVPDTLSSMLKGANYQGTLSFNLPKLTYNPSTGLDFAGTLSTDGHASLTAGVPLSDLKGTLTLAGSLRQSRLTTLKGALAIDSLKIAGRPAQDVRADINKPINNNKLSVSGVRGLVAGGALSGDVAVTLPDPGPAHYAVNMILRNADVKQVAGDDSLNGKFTGSLELEGNAGDPKSRIGRGDVLASGKDMYKVPVLMGLLQITNLSLPFTSPFNQAQAQYIIQGSQMTFENIDLRGESIVMQGAGSINFDTKKVNLTFNTDAPSHWLKLPIVQDFWQSAKKELFQITVHGTVEDPKVSANPFHTVTTTVDEVLHGDDAKSSK